MLMRLRISVGGRVWLTGAGLIIAIIICLLIFLSKSFLKHAPRLEPRVNNRSENDIGVIRLAPTNEGTCRVIAFDNRSGKFEDRGSVACDNDGRNHFDRFDAIREGFG